MTAAAESSRSRPRILVADDETIIAMQIGELLEAEGYELAGVVGAADQAVAMAREKRPDLVLMDIVMPPTDPDDPDAPADGIDACAVIQRELGIPVVLLTAHGEEHFLRRARASLPSAYLIKPCQNTQIRAAIEVALAQKPHRDPAAPFRLREAHHRLKNSFSLLNNMLRIQELQTADASARHSLADAGARVLAMARAHEAMSSVAPGAPCDAKSHVEGLARTLFEAQAPPPPMPPLALRLEVDAVRLLPAQLIPCGIFLAEGITNAVAHAFDGGAGEVRVVLRVGAGQAELSVADDGKGLPENVAALGQQSFGLQCLQAAAEQLEGKLEMGASEVGGARFSVRFPLYADYQSRSA